MKKLSIIALATAITLSSFASIPNHSLSDTGKVKVKKHNTKKVKKDTTQKGM